MARTVPGWTWWWAGIAEPGVHGRGERTPRSLCAGGACQPDRQNGAWIVQAHEWGKYVGRADFVHRNGSFTLVRYAQSPSTSSPLPTLRAPPPPTARPSPRTQRCWLCCSPTRPWPGASAGARGAQRCAAGR